MDASEQPDPAIRCICRTVQHAQRGWPAVQPQYQRTNEQHAAHQLFMFSSANRPSNLVPLGQYRYLRTHEPQLASRAASAGVQGNAAAMRGRHAHCPRQRHAHWRPSAPLQLPFERLHATRTLQHPCPATHCHCMLWSRKSSKEMATAGTSSFRTGSSRRTQRPASGNQVRPRKGRRGEAHR